MVEALGWLTIFLGGGFAFATVSALIAMRIARRQEIGALVWGGVAFKGAIVVWIGLFFWFTPVTISFGAAP